MKNFVAIRAKSKKSVNGQILSLKPGDRSVAVDKTKFDPNKHTFRLDTSYDNIKLGKMASWSTVYGTKPIFVKRMNGYVVGTCGQECGKKGACEEVCYVDKSYWKPDVVFGHARNTIGLRQTPEKVFKDLDQQLTRSKTITTVRLNQSGELESTEEFLRWCLFAKRHPNVKFFIYTKQYKYVETPLLDGLVPKNFRINYSIFKKHGVVEFNKVKHLENVSCFEYDDGKGVEIPIAKKDYCPAYMDGKLNHDIPCNVCRKCIDRNVKCIGCKSHQLSETELN